MSKINWISILQGWTMLWVVVGHAPLDMETMSGYALFLYKIAYSFHMPLFFMISGYLFYMTRLSKFRREGSPWPYKRIMLDKLKRLGVPFIVFTIFAMILKTIFAGDMARPSQISINEFLKAILFPTEGPLMELWFVAVLFWMFALTPIWDWILKQKTRIYVTLALFLVLFFVPCNVNFLCIGKVTSHIIWFFCGVVLCKFNTIDILKNHRVPLFIAGICIWAVGLIVKFPLLAIVGGISTSVALALIIDNIKPALFSSFRDYTYQIFLIGIFAQIFVKMIYRRIDIPYSFAYILCILMGLYVPVLVAKILERVNYGPLLTIVGLKKK